MDRDPGAKAGLAAGPCFFIRGKEKGMQRRHAWWTLVVALGVILTFAAVGVAAEGAKIDLNKASAEELKTLDRIGEAVAQRIVEYREQNGPFATIEDLKKVKGIGDKVFDANKDRITVSTQAKK
jgi:competence ComEA-like helix-hairpin-helix protein